MIKLKRLKINRYRNVEPCDLVFGDRFNILLGPNGAGKTTLLNLISKVLRTSLGDTSDPFSIEIELSFPGGSIEGKIETFENTKASQTELSPELRTSRLLRPGAAQSTHVPLFELRVHHLTPPSIVTITRTEGGVGVLRDDRPWADKLFVQLFDTARLLNQVNLVANMVTTDSNDAILHQTGNESRFDESLDTFRAITARAEDSTINNVEIQPHFTCVRLARKELPHDRLIVFSQGIAPPSLSKLIEVRFRDEMTDISFNDNDLDFLSKACRLLGLQAASAKLELTGKYVHPDLNENTFELGSLRFLFTRKDGSIFQDQHLSYGQKRLLTFLYYLECNPSIVIADELVNGLHHAWIKECMEAIGERQAFLTSQNPLLLDYLFFTSVQEVKESFILCRTEAVGNSEKMIWRNLTDDEAAMFYSAYKVGIEHVGEILRTRGLW